MAFGIALIGCIAALVLWDVGRALRTDLIELDTTIEKLTPERTGRKGRDA